MDSEIIFCHISRSNSYTVVLPDTTEFGLFRTITILGWVNEIMKGLPETKLTIKAKGDAYIELQASYELGTREIDFSTLGYPYPIQALTLMATGANTWRIISTV